MDLFNEFHRFTSMIVDFHLNSLMFMDLHKCSCCLCFRRRRKGWRRGRGESRRVKMLFSRYRADQVSCQLRVLQNAKNCHIGITGARRFFVTNV